MYKKVIVHAGDGGFGGPLIIAPDEKKNVILYVTGGHIPDVAIILAVITGGELVDGFNTKVEDEQIAKRFIQASRGWIKYKPLFQYITHKEIYKEKIQETY